MLHVIYMYSDLPTYILNNSENKQYELPCSFYFCKFENRKQVLFLFQSKKSINYYSSN